MIGAGVAGQNAAAIALGMQAEVLLLDLDVARLRAADAIYQNHLQTVASSTYEIEALRARGRSRHRCGAHPRGESAVSDQQRTRFARMKRGPCWWTSRSTKVVVSNSRPTTHAAPTYEVHGSLFYCVANMPGAVPTSTWALTNVTLPYLLKLADHGWREACRRDHSLALGLNTRRPDHLQGRRRCVRDGQRVAGLRPGVGWPSPQIPASRPTCST